jgi:glycosidase
VDTYKYCDEKFLNAINTALEKEFPGITVFGEAWTNTVAAAAYFSQNNIGSPFRHNLQGVTDFPLQGAIMDAINQPMGWTEGVNKLYMTLAQDFLYRQPMRNCIFLDNHDMNRFYSMAGEDLRKFKLGTGLLLTLRGIPQLYYGTEILMKNFKNPSDAQVRNDFPGGWASDSINKFSATGRTASENEAFEYIRKLAVFRRQSTAIASGKLMQFQPQDGIYVYFRYDTSQTVMCILNTKSQQVTLPTDRFRERLTGYSRGKNVVSGETVSVEKELSLPPQSLTVLALGKS